MEINKYERMFKALQKEYVVNYVGFNIGNISNGKYDWSDAKASNALPISTIKRIGLFRIKRKLNIFQKISIVIFKRPIKMDGNKIISPRYDFDIDLPLEYNEKYLLKLVKDEIIRIDVNRGE